ncbi:hypothetical protein HK407_04g08310 [Ordospora pajunii]|uniref:uncharacterized protein n=1 Tax=Ordospora pajunii TaxID=3039483 RepID=UPI0029526B5C|nr:uncharacterized protein HK407_04g08310 [Ordospora pajunii]KAH9411720.1 hypothetical protein HK407_04g08310 [Ordospora pajunii]
MVIENLRRLHNSFANHIDRIYLRSEEISEINSFVESERLVLHICGNPGTGKTHVTKNTLKCEFLYINYYAEKSILESIRKSTSSVVVIDEFDKYYYERSNECLQAMAYLRKKKRKTITLSNNLGMPSDTLFFKPYTSLDMELILKQKVAEESTEEILSSTSIKIISKRFGPSGDLRLLFKHVQDAIAEKILSAESQAICNTLAIGSSMKATSDASLVFEGIATDKNECLNQPANFHHATIHSLISNNKRLSKIDIYSKYLNECHEMKIPSYDRVDFNIIYDIYN